MTKSLQSYYDRPERHLNSSLVSDRTHDLSEIGGNVSGRTLQIILVIDASGSMEQNGRMAKANNAIDVSLGDIRDIQKRYPYIHIQVSVLTFASMVSWMEEGPKDVDSFVYQHLKPGGMTNLADALAALEECLHKSNNQDHNGFIDSSKSIYPPAIMFVSDGGANGRDYHGELEKLRHNGYFMCAARTAVAIDDKSIIPVLEELTGNPDTVLFADDRGEKIAQAIETCLVGSVTVSSTTGPSSTGTATEDVARLIQDEKMDDDEIAPTQSFYDLIASAQGVEFN